MGSVPYSKEGNEDKPNGVTEDNRRVGAKIVDTLLNRRDIGKLKFM